MRFLAAYYQRPLGETVAGALPPRLRSLKALPKKKPATEKQGEPAHFVKVQVEDILRSVQ